MELIKADILANLPIDKTTLILHGCNCFHTMGAGIAAYLARKFPIIKSVDRLTPYGDVNKLGTFSVAIVEKRLIIFNCYTQYKTGPRACNYEAIGNVLKAISENDHVMGGNTEIRSPQIGCGLAGGDWNKVEPLFDEFLPLAKIYYI